MATLATAEEAASPLALNYIPRGSARSMILAKETEVLMSGPAGTGKSRACLEKLHLAAQNHAGMRGLIVRKTRESLTEAALVTFENHVLDGLHAYLLDSGGQRKMRQSYHYNNGSTLVVGGLDKAQKVMSTEYDMVYVQEAIELTETDWESLTTRLRNGKMPYQQILADTNPDSPSHWLKRRCDADRSRLIECRHEDNPVLFDEHREMTPRGSAYLSKLDALTGPRKHRLRYGRWVQAEGVVYDGWDAAIHVIDRHPIPEQWRRFIAIDFGFTNPFVAQWWALDPDDRMYLYREIYKTQTLVEDHAAQIRSFMEKEPPIVGIVCDHDAEGRATLVKYLERGNFAAKKEVTEGIQAMAARLRPAGDGIPRLFVMRDSLVQPDPLLIESAKPTCFIQEIDGYIWDSSSAAKQIKGDIPVKLHDHAMDTARYAVRFAGDLCGGGEINGSDPADSILATLPSGTFQRDEPIESVMGDIMGMRF